MPLTSAYPLLYLITDGTAPRVAESAANIGRKVLEMTAAAVQAGLAIVQIREKNLAPRTLYELTRQAARLTRHTKTQLLLNDRADIARAARADGVHLTTQSLPAEIVRRAFGPDFIIGVSTHNLTEAESARAGGADFITFGPVFATPSKRAYGPPVGLAALTATVTAVAPLPVLALGGITQAHLPNITRTGAAGLAAISLWSAAASMPDAAQQMRRNFGVAY